MNDRRFWALSYHVNTAVAWVCYAGAVWCLLLGLALLSDSAFVDGLLMTLLSPVNYCAGVVCSAAAGAAKELRDV